MAQPISGSQIALALSGEIGIPFAAEDIAGGLLRLRPVGAPIGRGFTITLQINISTVQAEWRPDGLAAPLVTMLRESMSASSDFVSELIQQVAARGWRITVEGLAPGDRADPLVRVRSLPSGAASREHRAIQAAAICASVMFALTPESSDAEDNAGEGFTGGGAVEGAMRGVILTVRERDPRNRAICLSLHGPICAACGLDPGRKYGPLALGHIHVHHVEPLSQFAVPKRIDPRRDLVPLCPTCHMVVHLGRPNPYTVEQVKQMITNATDTQRGSGNGRP